MLKRLRAALMTALTWTVTWSAWGALVSGAGVALDLRVPIPFREFTFGLLMLRSAAVGFVGGAVFAAILGIVYRNRALDSIKAERLTIIGTLAGLVVPVIGGMVTIDTPGVELTQAEVAGAALLLYVAPGLLTSYGTLRLALDPKRAVEKT